MLWAIRLRTPGDVHCWVGHDHHAYVGPVAQARKFSTPADAECYMQSHEFPGFCYEVVKVSEARQWI